MPIARPSLPRSLCTSLMHYYSVPLCWSLHQPLNVLIIAREAWLQLTHLQKNNGPLCLRKERLFLRLNLSEILQILYLKGSNLKLFILSSISILRIHHFWVICHVWLKEKLRISSNFARFCSLFMIKLNEKYYYFKRYWSKKILGENSSKKKTFLAENF